MRRKIRLYRGPFDGKVMESPEAGRNEILIRAPKKMTRKQRYEFERDLYFNSDYTLNPAAISSQLPITTARYRLAMFPYGGMLVPCTHPDGSLIYEWDQPRRKK